MEIYVRGYYDDVCKDVWTATVGEELQCARESGNSTDLYTVAILKDNEVVEHIPQTISRMCALLMFLEQNDEIVCTIVH